MAGKDVWIFSEDSNHSLLKFRLGNETMIDREKSEKYQLCLQI